MTITTAVSMTWGTTMTFAGSAPSVGRTGGPDNDDEDELVVRRLLPLLAVVLTLAFVFG